MLRTTGLRVAYITLLAVGCLTVLASCTGGDGENGETDEIPTSTTTTTVPTTTTTTTLVEEPVIPPTTTTTPPQPTTTTSSPPVPTTEQETTTQTRPSGGGTFVYIVETGDYLGSIAEKYNVTVDAIVEANNLDDPNLIRADDELIIPPEDN